jgi:hypothetical protein
MFRYTAFARPSIPHSIIVILAPLDRRGRFSARLIDGRPLVSSSRLPFCDSARELIRLGYAPDLLLLMRHEGSSVVALRSMIGTAAKLTVEESAHGPIFRSAREGPQSAVAAPPNRQRAGSLPRVATAGLQR